MYYHVTPTHNIESILKNGIQPSIGDRSLDLGEKEPRIYLFTSIDSCKNALMNWLGNYFEDEDDGFLSILEINPDFVEGLSEAEYEIASYQVILPVNITKIFNESFSVIQVF